MALENALALHQQLADTAARMLAFAGEGQWNPLPELDARFRWLADRLPAAHELTAPQRETAATLVARARAAQQELAALLDARLRELERGLEDLHRRRILCAAYRPED